MVTHILRRMLLESGDADCGCAQLRHMSPLTEGLTASTKPALPTGCIYL